MNRRTLLRMVGLAPVAAAAAAIGIPATTGTANLQHGYNAAMYRAAAALHAGIISRETAWRSWGVTEAMVKEQLARSVDVFQKFVDEPGRKVISVRRWKSLPEDPGLT